MGSSLLTKALFFCVWFCWFVLLLSYLGKLYSGKTIMLIYYVDE